MSLKKTILLFSLAVSNSTFAHEGDLSHELDIRREETTRTYNEYIAAQDAVKAAKRLEGDNAALEHFLATNNLITKEVAYVMAKKLEQDAINEYKNKYFKAVDEKEKPVSEDLKPYRNQSYVDLLVKKSTAEEVLFQKEYTAASKYIVSPSKENSIQYCLTYRSARSHLVSSITILQEAVQVGRSMNLSNQADIDHLRKLQDLKVSTDNRVRASLAHANIDMNQCDPNRYAVGPRHRFIPDLGQDETKTIAGNSSIGSSGTQSNQSGTSVR